MIEAPEGIINIKNFYVLPSQCEGDPTLISGPNEAGNRVRLLESTKINKEGIAICIDDQTGVETLLTTVVVELQSNQPQPLTISSDNQTTQLLLPDSQTHKVGLFVGTNKSGLRAVIRNNEYPGLPLTSSLIGDYRQEAWYKICGINREVENTELYRAGRIKLFSELGFPEDRTRAIFKCGFWDDAWMDSPLYCRVESGIYRPGSKYEQSLITRLQILIYKDLEQSSKNPFLGKLVGAFDIQIATD